MTSRLRPRFRLCEAAPARRKCARPRAVHSGRGRISALCGSFSLRPERAARGRTHEEAFCSRGRGGLATCSTPAEGMCTAGPCTQDVGASAPYAEVPPYVLSVRPAAARMERPRRPRGKRRGRGRPRHLLRHLTFPSDSRRQGGPASGTPWGSIPSPGGTAC